MNKTEIIRMIERDYDHAKKKYDEFNGRYDAGAFSNQMFYEGQMFGFKQALLALEHLDTIE